jgi:hypothetical protein
MGKNIPSSFGGSQLCCESWSRRFRLGLRRVGTVLRGRVSSPRPTGQVGYRDPCPRRMVVLGERKSLCGKAHEELTGGYCCGPETGLER